MHQVLYTPWRYAYITGDKTAEAAQSGAAQSGAVQSGAAQSEGCFFCAAEQASDDPERLVVHRSEHHLVLLNRHPYNSGHLMVAPRVHASSPSDVTGEALAEFWPLVLRVRDVLQEVYSPHGFNLGMNLGSAAGAGVPGHFHFHLVPRWQGDCNFMGAVGDVRLVPEDPLEARRRLRRLFAET